MKHSSLGASVIHRRLKCPGSLRACKDIPSTTNVYAQEGTAAHSLGEVCLLHEIKPRQKLGVNIANSDGSQFEVTEDMAESVGQYVAAVRADYEELSPGVELMVEQNFNLDWLAPGMGMFGTNDAAIRQKFGVLKVYDYKHGKGVLVNAEDNAQLKYYALGALWDYELKRFKVQDTIICEIWQPRAPTYLPYSRAEYDPDDLVAWGRDVLLPGAEKCMEPDAPLRAGDWCKFCPAMASCAEIRDLALKTAQMDFSNEGAELVLDVKNAQLPLPVEMSPLEISKTLMVTSLIGAWIKEVQDYALSKAKSGEKYPSFKLVQGRKTRKWLDEAQAAGSLGSTFSTKIYAPSKMLTVAQMEKMIKTEGGDVKTEFDGLVGVTRGVALVPESDKRPEYSVGVEFDKEPLE